VLRERYPEVGDLSGPVYLLAPAGADDVAVDEWVVIPADEDAPVVLRPPPALSAAIGEMLGTLSARTPSGQVVVFCEWNGSLSSPDSPYRGRTVLIDREELVRQLVAGALEVDVIYLVRGASPGTEPPNR